MSGRLIVIDGSDGSGKSTQYALLQERLHAEGIAFESIKFPQYGQPSAYCVEQYLRGAYGAADAVPPKRASLFYAMDRFGASARLRSQLEAGTLLLADRYTVANMAHQGAKLHDPAARRELYLWLDRIEHEILGSPRPDVTLVLRVTPEQAQTNITARAHEKDIHEADQDFLRRSLQVYEELAELFPERIVAIDCMNGRQEMQPANEIHERIWHALSERGLV